MNLIFDFFLAPYREASFLDIFLEIIAVIFGIASVYFAKKESILVYPTGLVSTIIYVFICWQFTLYGDLIINIYYTGMSIFGWYMWTRIVDNHHLPITRCSKKDWQKAISIFVLTTIFIIGVYTYFDRFDRMTDYFDTFTSGMFFAGMWLMANKKIENWIIWIVGNIISIPLYFIKGLGFSGIQFTVFLVLAFYGYIAWKKILDKSVKTS